MWWNWTRPAPTWLSETPRDATTWTGTGLWTGQEDTPLLEPHLSTKDPTTDQRASSRPAPPMRHWSLRQDLVIYSTATCVLIFYSCFLCLCHFICEKSQIRSHFSSSRCYCRAGTQVYAGNTLWRELMRRRNTITHGPSYAPSAQQPVPEVSLNVKDMKISCPGWFESPIKKNNSILSKISLPWSFFRSLFWAAF